MKNRIAEFRRARKMKVKELATKVGVSAPFVSQMELGTRNVSLKNLEKLATALGCRPDELIATDGPPPVFTEVEPEVDALLLAAWKQMSRKSRKLLVQFAMTMAAEDAK